MGFKVPPLKTTETDEIRCVGFEIEFTGLTIGDVTQVMQHVFGGEFEKSSSVEYVLHTPEYGKFKVELDWAFLKKVALDAQFSEQGLKWVDFLHRVAQHIVPMEVVSPPFPLDQLDKLDELIPALRDSGAKGTDNSMIAAFGVHINPELPALDVQTIQAYLKAFGLLQWWLNEAHEVNLTRKISPYIHLYSQNYLNELLNKSYQDIDELIDDYLVYNPSRNRALDMLPLFAFINESKVRNVVTDSKINPRPTLHYRLPDSLIEHTHWSFASSWNLWNQVEKLAADPVALNELSQRFQAMVQPLLGVKRSDWVKEVEQWIENQELA